MTQRFFFGSTVLYTKTGAVRAGRSKERILDLYPASGAGRERHGTASSRWHFFYVVLMFVCLHLPWLTDPFGGPSGQGANTGSLGGQDTTPLYTIQARHDIRWDDWQFHVLSLQSVIVQYDINQGSQGTRSHQRNAKQRSIANQQSLLDSVT